MSLTDAELCRAAAHAVVSAGGNKAAAARALGVAVSTLKDRISRHREKYNGEFETEAPRQATADYLDAPALPTMRVRVQADSVERWRVVAVGDFHSSPRLKDQRAKWIGRFAGETLDAFDGQTAIVQIGDFASFDSFSFHDRNESLSGKTKPSFKEDLEAWERDLSLFDDGLAGYDPDAKHETMGNHDCPFYGRPHKWMNSHPEMAGMIDFEVRRLLERRDWTFSPFGHHWFLGGVGFTHSPLSILGKEVGGENTSNSIATKATYDIVYGHTHKADDIRKVKIGHGNYVRVVNLGCALPWGHLEHYVNHGAMSGWWWGVSVIDIWGGHIQQVTQVSMKELEDRYAF